MSGIEPKYVQVQRRVLEWIGSGKLSAGERLPSEASLCDQLGVSRITVRRALADLARQGYIESRGGYGHVVRAAEPEPVIGVLMNYPMFSRTRKNRTFSTFALLLMSALRLELQRRGYRNRLYLPQPHETEHHMDHSLLLGDLDRGVLSGLITSAWPHDASKHPAEVHWSDAQVSARIEALKLPLVSVTGRDVVQATVSTDYFAIGYRGADHFLQRGIRDIALLTNHQPDNPTLDGFHQALADHGQRPRESWICHVDHFDEQHGYDAFARWWSALETRPQALVIGDDQTGKGAMLAAVALGLTTSEQLHIACQSLHGSGMFWPRPCVKLQLDPMDHARSAVEKIARMLADPTAAPPRTWVGPTVVEDPADVAAPLAPFTAATQARGAQRSHDPAARDENTAQSEVSE
ncbi:MAG: GntR family transcriptional regulator [Phycisphaeraceae bacterium]